jgi:hypothetical protein
MPRSDGVEKGHLMNNATSAPAVDPETLMTFVFQAVEEVSAVLNGALIVMGDHLLLRTWPSCGPSTPAN